MQGDDGFRLVTLGPNQISDPSVSSFEIIDALIADLLGSGVFPNLQHIVISGHSAGGQFTQRYAVGGLEPILHPDIGFSYFPANPKSYMRMGAAVLDPVPGALDYKYGFKNRLGTPYMTTLGFGISSDPAVNPYVAQYLARDVTYLIGNEDDCGCDSTDQNGDSCTPDKYFDDPDECPPGPPPSRYGRRTAPSCGCRGVCRRS